jgi:PilZ domain
MTEPEEVKQRRRHQRLELEVELTVRTDGGVFPGRTHDISESGMSAVLPVELREGEEVELQIRLPRATETIGAIVRHRNVFRHGFEFVLPLHGIFRNEPITGRLLRQTQFFREPIRPMKFFVPNPGHSCSQISVKVFPPIQAHLPLLS